MNNDNMKMAMQLGRLEVLNDMADFVIKNAPKYPSALEVFVALNDFLKEIKQKNQ